jgi:hypothetical protein
VVDEKLKFQFQNLEARDNFGDPDVGGRIILKRVLTKLGVRVWN